MFSASIEYVPVEGQHDHVRRAWETMILAAAKTQEGLVQMQLFESGHSLLAVGTWQGPEFAQAFMATGVFDRFMEVVGESLESRPNPRPWKRVANFEASLR